MRKDLDLNRLNAYSATAHMYAAIANGEVPADRKGGIIIFPQEVSDLQLIADKLDCVHWTAGRFCRGRHTGKNGEVYSEDSLSVEITGVSDDALIKICKELCRALDQETALIKMYSERNRIVVCKD